jgi:hypothetical protein
MNTLNVENHAQKVLFEKELKGQLSDGHWENAGPFEHWKDWCVAEVRVDPTNAGIDFHPRRQRYNFANGELLEAVGARMLSCVRLARVVGYGNKAYECAQRYLLDYEGRFMPDWHKGLSDADFAHVSRTVDVSMVEHGVGDESLYDVTQLRKDLRRLGQIIKMRTKQ